MDQQYDSLAQCLGHVSSVAPDELRKVSSDDIVQANAKISGGKLAAFFITDDASLDGAFFPSDTDGVTIQPFCKRLMIGDCAVEGIVMAPVMEGIPQSDLKRLFFTAPTLQKSYLSKMGITTPDAAGSSNHDDIIMPNLIQLQTELAFFGPIQAVIDAAPAESTYVYRFNRPKQLGRCCSATLCPSHYRSFISSWHS